MKQILKVLVGSRAHGLATKESDYDYRGVFVEKTSKILKLGENIKNTKWIENDVDNTSWELGHFLQMAIKCNPTILETFVAPIIDITEEGIELRELFQYVWNSVDVYNAFKGYGLNQRKKYLDNKDNRANKYAVACLRSLYQGCVLLSTDTFSTDMTSSPIYDYLKKWKSGDYQIGEVMQLCYDYELKIKKCYDNNPNKKTNLEKVNKYLLKQRQYYF